MATDDPITLDFLSMFALRSYRAEEKRRKDAALKELVRQKIITLVKDLNIDTREHLPALRRK
jgi:hypothetical protein